MPAPLQVDSNITRLPVWQVDNDGNTIQSGTLTVRGTVVGQGNQTITGNLTVSGTTTLGGRETISGKDAGGLLLVTNGVAATPGDVIITEAAATNIALAVRATGDTVARWTVDASGKLLWGPGSGAGDTDLYRVGSNILQTDGTFQVLLDQNVGGNISAITVGKGLAIKEGVNAKQGVTAAMTAGSIVVSTTAVTANSRILLTAQTIAGTQGALGVSARTAGTSFTITSSSNTDTSTVGWFISEPA